MDLYNLQEIESELHIISDLACGAGSAQMMSKGDEQLSIKDYVEKINQSPKDFFIACHNGFKEAQNRIVTLLLKIQDEQVINKSRLKSAREIKNRKQIDEFVQKEKYLEHISTLFKHGADAICWQLIRGQLYISRQLYLEVGGSKKLRDTNLSSVQVVANQINANPENFVLITDITNNVQVGDLIGFLDGQFTIIEVKEGQKNWEVIKIIKELSDETKSCEEVMKQLPDDPKFLEQLERTLKQHEVLTNVEQIISEDKGIDPILKKEIKIHSPEEATPYYNSRLMMLEKQLNNRNLWGYDVIEDCLHIGVYKGEKRFIGRYLLEEIAKTSNIENYIIVDALSVVGSLNKPIFYFPFSVDLIFDILFERVKMYYMLNVDKFMDIYTSYGYVAKWASRKETHRVEEAMKLQGLLKFKNRGIKIMNSEGNEIWLFGGTVLRIIFEHIYPSYIAYSTKYYSTKSCNLEE